MATEMTNLRVLTTAMINQNETRTVFPYVLNRKHFSCIFIIDTKPYTLFVTTLGADPIVIDLSVNPDTFIVGTYFGEKYSRLLHYLGLKYNRQNPFSPDVFLENLNQQVPQHCGDAPNYTDVLNLASAAGRHFEDKDKPYFCGWRNNSNTEHVRSGNYIKTLIAFGEEFAEMSKQKNISSRWTATPNEERIAELNNIRQM